MKNPGQLQTTHICVFEIIEGDRDYTVRNWPESFQEQLEIDLDEKKLTNLNYDADVTQAIIASELAIGRNVRLNCLIVNDDFSSSYLVFA